MSAPRGPRLRNVRRILPGVVLIVCGLLPLHPLLHDHVELHGSHRTVFDGAEDDHGVSHDHPVVGSVSIRVMPHASAVMISSPAPASRIAEMTRGSRDVRSFGGIRADNDVGWHVFLSTFLI